VAHLYNLSNLEIGRIAVHKTSPSKKFMRPPSPPTSSQLGREVGIEGLQSKLVPAKCETPISKMTKAKRAGDVTQVVTHLPSKCKALNSKPRVVQVTFRVWRRLES
jgi:hypothetical protein